MSERGFCHRRDRYEEGPTRQSDRRLSKASAELLPVDEPTRVEPLYRERYQGFTAKHFCEHLVSDRGFAGSRPGRSYVACLIKEKGMVSNFRGVPEVIIKHGLFCALYTDCGATTSTRPRPAKRSTRTGSPSEPHLGPARLESSPARSSEVRGHSERSFGTLQGRLPKELRLADIIALAPASRFIAVVLRPAHIAASRSLPDRPALPSPRSSGGHCQYRMHSGRSVVDNDNTVCYRGLNLRVPPSPHTPHFVRAGVPRTRIRRARWRSPMVRDDRPATTAKFGSSRMPTLWPPTTARRRMTVGKPRAQAQAWPSIPSSAAIDATSWASARQRSCDRPSLRCSVSHHGHR